MESDAGGMVSVRDERVARPPEAGRGYPAVRAEAAGIAADPRGAKRPGGTANAIIGNRGAIHVDAVTYEPARRGWASARSTLSPGSGLHPQAALTRETMKPITAAW
jgi:hypothetical protein